MFNGSKLFFLGGGLYNRITGIFSLFWPMNWTSQGEPASGPAWTRDFGVLGFGGFGYLGAVRCTPFPPPFGFFGMAYCGSVRN